MGCFCCGAFETSGGRVGFSVAVFFEKKLKESALLQNGREKVVFYFCM